jgi:hypothetical protein
MADMQKDVYTAIAKKPINKNMTSKIGHGVLNWFTEQLGSVDNLVELITDKKTAQELSMQSNEKDYYTSTFKRTETLLGNIREALNIQNDKEFDKLIEEWNKPLFKIAPRATDLLGESLIEPVEINTWNLIYIDLIMRNKQTNKNMQKYYDLSVIKEHIDKLTPEQKKLEDVLFDSVQDWEELNPYFVMIFNRDLGTTDNYFPRVSYHSPVYSLFNYNIEDKNKQISAIKSRDINAVPKLDTNPVVLAVRHLQQTEYVKNIAPKLKTIKEIFSSDKIKQVITNKYDANFYNVFMDQINSLNMNNFETDTKIGQIVSQVIGNIAQSVTNTGRVALKQMTSIPSYSEGINKAKFMMNLTYSLAHPKEALKFLTDNSNYLSYRYEKSNQSKVMEKIRNQEKNIVKKALDVMGDNAITKAFNYIFSPAGKSLLEWGDYFSVVGGGYARYLTQIQSGMSVKDAIKDFELQTTATQQSNLKTQKSFIQNKQGFGNVLITLFKSQDFQYNNKVLTNLIRYVNNDILAKDVFNSYFLYKLLPSLLINLGVFPLTYIFYDMVDRWLGDKKKKRKSLYNQTTAIRLLTDASPITTAFIANGVDFFGSSRGLSIGLLYSLNRFHP